MQGKLIVHSERVINECERYFEDENGKLKHPLVGKGRADAPEKSHGDSAIACAMGWWAMHTDPDAPAPEEEPEIPYGGYAWRRQQYLEGQNRRSSLWDPYEDRKHSAFAGIY